MSRHVHLSIPFFRRAYYAVPGAAGRGWGGMGLSPVPWLLAINSKTFPFLIFTYYKSKLQETVNSLSPFLNNGTGYGQLSPPL